MKNLLFSRKKNCKKLPEGNHQLFENLSSMAPSTCARRPAEYIRPGQNESVTLGFPMAWQHDIAKDVGIKWYKIVLEFDVRLWVIDVLVKWSVLIYQDSRYCHETAYMVNGIFGFRLICFASILHFSPNTVQKIWSDMVWVLKQCNQTKAVIHNDFGNTTIWVLLNGWGFYLLWQGDSISTSVWFKKVWSFLLTCACSLFVTGKRTMIWKCVKPMLQ